MGIKQKVERLKQARAEHIKLENKSNSPFGHISRTFKEGMAQGAAEAEQDIIDEHQPALDRHAALANEAARRMMEEKAARFKELAEQLGPYAKHLIFITNFGNGWERGEITAKRIEAADIPKDTPFGFSVHLSEARIRAGGRLDDNPIAEFEGTAEQIYDALKAHGYSRALAGGAEVYGTELGLDLSQVAQAAENTKTTTKSEDYQHVAVISGMSLEGLGLDYFEDSRRPVMLLGISPDGTPQWQRIGEDEQDET